MRSALVAAAFAAGALAVPLMERDIVYETDIVYATKYVTVTAGDAAPTEAPAQYTLTKSHYGHRKPKPKSSSVEQPQEYGGWTSSWASTWTVSAPASTAAQEQAPSSSPEEQAPAYTSVEAPAPSSYEAPQSTYQPAPTSSESAPSSAAGSSDSDPKPTDYQSTVLWHHNVHRYNHSSPALTWNESLAATAQKIADTCIYEHSMYVDGAGYGQNIAAGVKGDNVSAVITELFYNGEERAYADAGNYGKGTANEDSEDGFNSANFEVWGHMTQMVWSNTTTVGCVTKDCSAQGLGKTGGSVAPYFTVCNYYPQGNVRSSYAYSVKQPRGDATCHWNDSE